MLDRAVGCSSRSERWMPCQQALQLIDRLERESSDCRKLVQYNQTVLDRQQQELEDAEAAAVKMIQDAEERLEQTRQILTEKAAQLAELEGQADEQRYTSKISRRDARSVAEA